MIFRFSYFYFIPDDTVLQYISFIDAQRIVDHLVKQIPEKVSYSSGPVFYIPVNPFDISGKMQLRYATVRGLENPKISDFSYNDRTRVLQATANFQQISLSMIIKNSLERNDVKNWAPTSLRFDMYECTLKLKGHFNGAEMWDTFAEVGIGSAKVYIKEIFRDANLTREISDYLEENLHRIIIANRNLVSNAMSEWAETGINILLRRIDSNNIEKL
nr:unnamed protein product [Callosobruchus chinensis]